MAELKPVIGTLGGHKAKKKKKGKERKEKQISHSKLSRWPPSAATRKHKAGGNFLSLHTKRYTR